MNAFRTDIKRAVFSPGFLAGAAGMHAVIVLSAVGAAMTALQSAAGDQLPTGFHVQALQTALSSDMMLLAVPILAALPYTAAFVDDQRSGYIKLYLPRLGKKPYVLGKVFATAASGGLALLVGIIAAALTLWLVFLPMEAAPQPDTAPQSVLYPLLGRACVFFLCGGLWSLAGALFAALTMNKYIAYASPFILYYLLVILCERYARGVYVLNPKLWLMAADGWPGGNWGVALLVAELLAVAGVGFAVTLGRRLGDG